MKERESIICYSGANHRDYTRNDFRFSQFLTSMGLLRCKVTWTINSQLDICHLHRHIKFLTVTKSMDEPLCLFSPRIHFSFPRELISTESWEFLLIKSQFKWRAKRRKKILSKSDRNKSSKVFTIKLKSFFSLSHGVN